MINLIFVSIYTECNRYYLHFEILNKSHLVNKSLNNIKLKKDFKFFRGKFHKLINPYTTSANGDGFIYINSISKFQ